MQSLKPAFIADEEEQTIIIKKEQDIVDEEFFQSKDLSEMEEALLLFDIERLCEIHYVLSKEEIKSLIESHVLQFLIQLTENNDITTDDLLFKYNFTVNCYNSFNENNNDEETVNNEEVSSLKPYMVDKNLFSSSKKKTSEFIIQTSNNIYTLKKDKQQDSNNSSKKQKLNSASNTGYSCGLTVGGLRKNYLVWKLLCDIYQLQILQKKITQRELYYMNVSFFNDQIQCNNYIDNICNILKLDRTLLNIVTMGKGLIYSNDGKNNSIVNITPNISQQSIIENIPGDLEYLENNVTFRNDFCKDNNNCKNVTLLIIEKECIFKRLIEDKIYKFIPNIILITGCGFPSLTTRYLCHSITKKFNTCNLKVFGLFDFNIYGFQILNNYKYGSIALSKHVTSQTSTIGEKLQWLGLRYNDIKDIPAMYNQKVTNRELQYIEKHLKYHQLKMNSNTTISSNKDNDNSYQSIITELEKMKTCKYEIEIIANIHGIDKMGIYFAKKIVSYK